MNQVLTSIICLSLIFQTSFSYANNHEKVDDFIEQLLNQGTDRPAEPQGNDSNFVVEDIVIGSADEEVVVERETVADDPKIEEVLEEILNGLPDNGSNNIDVEQRAEDQTVINEAQVPSGEERINTSVRESVDVLDDGKFDYIKYNELRDAQKHDVNVPSTSAKILEALAANPFYFTQEEGVNFYIKTSSHRDSVSAIGPVISSNTEMVKIGDRTKRAAVIQDDRMERRRNVVISVSYERVVDVTKEDTVFDIDLLLFIHSNKKGFFFKKINISVNWNLKDTNGNPLIEVKEIYESIPLSDTDFEVRSEISSQKTIIRDRRHGITRVLPIAVGAVTAREAFGGKTSSMTLMIPDKDGEIKDFKFEDAVLIKKHIWNESGFYGRNSYERRVPDYYQGRPFIGIIDRSRVSNIFKDERNNYVMLEDEESVDYAEGYRQIGYHYQIDSDKLRRTFVSHGCMRMQDHDLYMLYDILHEGPKDMIPVEVKMNLDIYTNVDSIYKRESGFKKVIYSNSPNSPDIVVCDDKSTYIVRRFGNYHTVSENGCLTKLTNETQMNLNQLRSYVNGDSNSIAPRSALVSIDHDPSVRRRNFLNENAAYIRLVDNSITNINSLSQAQVISLVGKIKQFKAENSAGVRRWKVVTGTVNADRNDEALAQNLVNYRAHCQGRVIGSESSDATIVKFCRDVASWLNGKVIVE